MLLLFLLSLTALVLLTPRRYAILAMAAGALYLTQYQSWDVLGLHVYAMRFLEIAGIIRVAIRREASAFQANQLDRAFIALYLLSTIIFLLRSTEGFAYQIGTAVDALLCYFFFRCLARDIDDFRWLLRAFAILLAPYVALLLLEFVTAWNPFALLGGNLPPAWFRKGMVRCFGSFRDPSILGSLGASFLPLYIGFGLPPGADRRYAVLGIILCAAIVVFSNSAGPIFFAAVGVWGWILWRFRDRLRLIRRLGLAALVFLALVMKAPIWYLPTHFSFGGSAWHRSYLIDVAVSHLGEWWVWGMPYRLTAHWLPYDLNTGVADITNEYIRFGLAAGVLAVFLFLRLLIIAFKNLGKKLAELRSVSPWPTEDQYLLWGLGVMLAGHMVNFFGIPYFDQFSVIWFMQLALISSLTSQDAGAFLRTTEGAWASHFPNSPSSSHRGLTPP